MENDFPSAASNHQGKKSRLASSKKGLFYVIAMLLITTAIFSFYLVLGTQNHFSQLDSLVNGTAPRPYVYRVLAPFIVKVVSTATHISLIGAAIIVMYLSLVGFSLTMLALAKTFIARQYAYFFSLLAPIGLVPFLFEQRHIYDFPNLFLFTLALYFLAENNFTKYLFIFTLCVFSKETSVLLIMFFVVQFKELTRKKYLLLITCQLGIYTIARYLLMELFKYNAGSVLEFHLADQAKAFTDHPIRFVLFLLALGIFFGTAIISRNRENTFLRNSLIIIAVPIFILYLFFGIPYEIRVFMEAYPPLFLLLSKSTIRAFEGYRRKHAPIT